MVSAAKKIKKSTSKYLPKKLDALVKSPKRHLYVIPMKMGIQCFQIVAHPLDSRCSLSRIGCGAGMTTFYETVSINRFKKHLPVGPFR